MNEAFNKRFTDFVKESKDKKKKAKGRVKNDIIIYKTFSEEAEENSSVYQSIVKKSEKHGIDIDLLGEVYDRGIQTWSEDSDVTPQQLAFNRVNSFISGGRALKEDIDLIELKETEDFKPGQNVWLKVKKTATSPHNGKVHKVTNTHVIIKASNGFRNQLYKAKKENVSSEKTDHGEFLQSWVNRNKLKEEAITENSSSNSHNKFLKNLHSRYDFKTNGETSTEKYKGITVHNTKFKNAKGDDHHLATTTINHETGEALHRFYKAGKHDLPASISYKSKLNEEQIDEISSKQMFDKNKVLHGAMSQDEYDKKWKKTKKPKMTSFKSTVKRYLGEEGNSQIDPKKREVGTKSLVDAFRRDTPGQEVVDETARSADKQPVVVPAHYDDHGNLIPAKTHMRRTNRSIVNKNDNGYDGK